MRKVDSVWDGGGGWYVKANLVKAYIQPVGTLHWRSSHRDPQTILEVNGDDLE